MNNSRYDQIDGWFCPIDMLLFDFFLQYQMNNSISGKMGEIGVYKGKSLIKLCEYSKPWEGLFALDISLTYENINIVCDNIHKLLPDYDTNQIMFICAFSRYMSCQNFNNNEYYRNTRFLHIDGGHSGIDTYNDIKLADDMLSYDGIIVLDDFPNPMYPGIKEAYYTYVAQHPESFKILISSPSKCYCCRPYSYDKYNNYIKNSIYKFIESEKFDLKNHSIIENINMIHNSYINIIDQNNGLNIYENHTYNLIKK